jgi:hypothetical protein
VLDGAVYLVDPYDVGAIAAGLRDTLTDPAMRAVMIARGLERAKAFSWEKSAREVLAVFDWVAAGAEVGVPGDRSAHDWRGPMSGVARSRTGAR